MFLFCFFCLAALATISDKTWVSDTHSTEHHLATIISGHLAFGWRKIEIFTFIKWKDYKDHSFWLLLSCGTLASLAYKISTLALTQ